MQDNPKTQEMAKDFRYKCILKIAECGNSPDGIHEQHPHMPTGIKKGTVLSRVKSFETTKARQNDAAPRRQKRDLVDNLNNCSPDIDDPDLVKLDHSIMAEDCDRRASPKFTDIDLPNLVEPKIPYLPPVTSIHDGLLAINDGESTQDSVSGNNYVPPENDDGFRLIPTNKVTSELNMKPSILLSSQDNFKGQQQGYLSADSHVSISKPTINPNNGGQRIGADLSKNHFPFDYSQYKKQCSPRANLAQTVKRRNLRNIDNANRKMKFDPGKYVSSAGAIERNTSRASLRSDPGSSQAIGQSSSRKLPDYQVEIPISHNLGQQEAPIPLSTQQPSTPFMALSVPKDRIRRERVVEICHIIDTIVMERVYIIDEFIRDLNHSRASLEEIRNLCIELDGLLRREPEESVAQSDQ